MASTQALLRSFVRARVLHPRPQYPSIAQASRQYRQSAPLFAYKDSQDRESINTGSTEGTKSGRDGDVAAQSDAAFNPDETAPEKEKETAGKQADGNPLEASGANQELSKPRGDERDSKKGGAGKETSKTGKASGAGSGKKNGKP